MVCPCHGEPCYWQKDKRCRAGGWWECAVKRAAFNLTRTTDPERNARVTQQKRDRYDADPVFRIGSNLKKRRAQRLKRLAARKARLTEEG